jgi:hypothetical protein
MSRICLGPVLLATFFAGDFPVLAEGPTAPDVSPAQLKKLGLEPVEPVKDPATGFVVGGVNATDLIRRLTELNGRSIADLEATMRPGASGEGGSEKGFLGEDESLLDVLASDNDFVRNELKLTHQQIARHLRVLVVIAPAHESTEIVYGGLRLRVAIQDWRGYQESPFHDGTKANQDVTVTNVETGARLQYSLLVPDMIERYGFYEGKGTPYRVDPKQVVEVLDFLKPATSDQ